MNEEEIKKLKEELKNDLGNGYYKMSQAKMITLIGCTITFSMTVFAFYAHNDVDIAVLKADNAASKTEIQSLKSTVNSLQAQINNLK